MEKGLTIGDAFIVLKQLGLLPVMETTILFWVFGKALKWLIAHEENNRAHRVIDEYREWHGQEPSMRKRRGVCAHCGGSLIVDNQINCARCTAPIYNKVTHERI